MTSLPVLPCPGSAGCTWYETAYEHYGIPYKYKSDTLTPIHAILRMRESRAGRVTETRRFDRSLPTPFGVGSTLVSLSPGYEAVMAARRAAWDKAQDEGAKLALTRQGIGVILGPS